MLRIFPLLIVFTCSLPAEETGLAPLWPTPGTAFTDGRPYADFVQATASGEPESALFGCVRNNGNRFHEALDIAPVLPRRKGEATDPVTAIHDGTVAHISKVAGNSSYGRYVVIEHDGLVPAIYSLYAHLASIPDNLAVGDRVTAGAILGVMGRSAAGYTIPRSRAHLHLEIGLRLSDGFQSWYDRQAYTSPNFHGAYNGINLVGMDPLAYFRAFRDHEAASTLDYFNRIRPAVLLHVRSLMVPDFLRRYPSLLLEGSPEEARQGWEVALSAWGMPISFRALQEGELRGVASEGQISVVAVDQEQLKKFDCRDLVVTRGGRVLLGDGSRRIMELLFMSD